MTRPTLMELAAVAGTVEDTIVAEIIDAGGDLVCVDGEEASQIVYQLASEVMIRRASTLSAMDHETLSLLRTQLLVWRADAERDPHYQASAIAGVTLDSTAAQIEALDRLLGQRSL